MPRMIMTGAGDRPSRLKSAPGAASSRPHRLALSNPTLIRMMAKAARATPTASIRKIAPALNWAQPFAEEEDTGGEDAKNAEGIAPADPCAEKTGDQKRQDAAHRFRSAQPADGLRLPPALVVGGDRHDQCRHQGGGRHAGEALSRDHHRRVRLSIVMNIATPKSSTAAWKTGRGPQS